MTSLTGTYGGWDAVPAVTHPRRRDHDILIAGEVLVQTRAHGLGGAGVTAQMYLPLARTHAWSQLSNYSRWVQYFPDIVRSEVIERGPKRQRLYQVARKAFLIFNAQVDIYLSVFELVNQQIQFRLEQGTFSDFSADLTLQDYGSGTLVTYNVQATPLIFVPSFLIEQAMQQDLPGNMKKMRGVLCAA